MSKIYDNTSVDCDFYVSLRSELRRHFLVAGRQVELQAGPVAVAACTYSIQGTAQHRAATLVAGQQMVLCVETRDQFGNLARVPAAEGSLQAQANGPQGTVRFEALPPAAQVRRMCTSIGFLGVKSSL